MIIHEMKRYLYIHFVEYTEDKVKHCHIYYEDLDVIDQLLKGRQKTKFVFQLRMKCINRNTIGNFPLTNYETTLRSRFEAYIS